MTTFAGWLAEQRKREDAVGWFARYWRDLPETPRLSSPASIASHLEDRTTKPGQDKAGERLPFGFTDPDGGNYVRDAYDQTLHQYREVRAQIVQSAAADAGVAGDTPEQPAGPQSPAGFAVEAATQAAMAAAQRHAAVPPAPDQAQMPPRAQMGTGELLEDIWRKLCRIEAVLGISADEPESAELPWGAWYAQADLAAAVE